MKKAAIAIDAWKLPIFERHLFEAGYEFELVQGPTDSTLILKVPTLSLKDLEKVVRAANTEAINKKHS